MIYGAILAGGIGSRMKLADMPKQFLMLGEKPIIIHTIEKFILNERFDMIYVGVHKDWKQHLKDLLKKYNIKDKRISVLEGGTDRNSTLINVINAIKKNKGITKDDILVSHDAVRPFVTGRILNDNIEAALEFGAADTVIPATDTIVESLDDSFISSIPARHLMYQGQTPQSFNIELFNKAFGELTEEQVESLTDACKIFTFRGVKVRLVEGEVYNMKITTISDYKIAQAVLEAKKSD